MALHLSRSFYFSFSRGIYFRLNRTALCGLWITLATVMGNCQTQAPQPTQTDLDELRQEIKALQSRVQQLEQSQHTQDVACAQPAGNVSSIVASNGQTTAAQANAAQTTEASVATAQIAEPHASIDPLHGTTVNLLMDGYYEWNFNNPIGRVNLLRAYDISSNVFALNQADLVLENAADPTKDKRFGARLDLQYGQATETLQGNSSNEPRPDVYRNIFQAYGTYVAPVGNGLTIDFGKFASSLGIEGNYTKDQMNYSRSFWFNFLPFYHMGVRAAYKLDNQVTLNYWAVNGTDQTEPFNGFKDQFVGLALQPSKTIAWNVNYYLGQEHPNVIYYPNGGAPANLPTEQGLPFAPIPNPPTGHLQIIDSYATWQVTPKFSTAMEGDYVIERLYTNSSPQHTDGGAVYARYQFTPKFALAGRAEYLSDRGGLFSNTTQALKETTITSQYKVSEGLLIYQEWRRDFSNQPYFLTDTLGVIKRDQNTASIGLVWWFGGKEGTW